MPTPAPGECVGWGEKIATERVYLGDTADVTLTFKARCAGYTMPLHIVLVMDGSGSMEGSKNRRMTDGAMELVRRLRLEKYPETRIGVVEFNTEARRLCGLINDEGRVFSCIRRVRAAGGKAIDVGLHEGLRLFLRERPALGKFGAYEVMLLFSDGHNDAGCAEAERATHKVKGQGVLLISVCVGHDCDDRCMRDLATSPRYFFEIGQIGQILPVFEMIRNGDIWIRLKKLTVTDRLAGKMRYVEDSATPAPTAIGPEADELRWVTNYVPAEGATITFKVEPQALGHQPTNIEAKADFVTNQNEPGSFVYPVPYVSVEVRPTPTPTLTPTPTPTSTPTATPTPTPRSRYLPSVTQWRR